MTVKEKLKSIFESLQEFGPEDFEDSFANHLYEMDDANDKAADIFLIENAQEFADTEVFASSGQAVSSWRWYFWAIAEADYPLEKMPSHVREIAERLYYKKEPASSQKQEISPDMRKRVAS